MTLALLSLLACVVVTTSSTPHTIVERVGHGNISIVIIDEVLPSKSYQSLRDSLRLREKDFVDGRAFPGKTAPIDKKQLDSILSAILTSQHKHLDMIDPQLFLQRDYIRGFASILCSAGWVHDDHQNTEHNGEASPAAVFYFGFDGAHQEEQDKPLVTTATGTAFYREKMTGIERTTVVESNNETKFCTTFPDSVRCPGGHHHHDHDRNHDHGHDHPNDTEPNNNNDAFEEIHRVEGVPNRLVIYPSDVLHNAWVESKKFHEGVDESSTSTSDSSQVVPSLPCSAKHGRMAISLFFLARHNAGREIVGDLDNAWRAHATNALQIIHRRNNVVQKRRRLHGCDPFKKGSEFWNVITAAHGCDMSTTMVVENSEELHIRGAAMLHHPPELARGGLSGIGKNVTDRHFLLRGTSYLTLMFVALNGAYVGNHDLNQCEDINFNGKGESCGFCRATYLGTCGGGKYCQTTPTRCCHGTCGEEQKGGAIRIEGSTATVLLIDVIFHTNIAFDGTGNIYSTSAEAKLYIMNMPIPAEVVGISPIYRCEAASTKFCSAMYATSCSLDTTSESKRIFCSCPAGRVGGHGTSKRSCAGCSQGKWSNVSGLILDDQCQLCLAGRWSDATGTTSNCTGRCGPGKYSNEIGLTSNDDCKKCSAGRWSASGNGFTSNEQCAGRCSPGRYSGETGLASDSQCRRCPAGKYSMAIGITSEEECTHFCSAGKWSDQLGLRADSECKLCSAGKWSDATEGLISDDDCELCSRGKFSTAKGITSDDACNNLCSVGRWSDTAGLASDQSCKLCFIGRFSNRQGLTLGSSCKVCPNGYSSISGSSTCQMCSVGRFNLAANYDHATIDSKCSPCPQGKSTANPGSSECQACAEGRYLNVAGTAPCVGCPPGKYGTVLGATSEVTSCTDCESGHYQDEKSGFSMCKICKPGTYMSVELHGQSSSEVCKTIDTATNLQVEYSVRHAIALRGINATVFNTNPSIVHSFRQTVATILAVQAPLVINILATAKAKHRGRSLQELQRCTVSYEIKTKTETEMKSMLKDLQIKMSSTKFTTELQRNIRASSIDAHVVSPGALVADTSMSPTNAGTIGRQPNVTLADMTPSSSSLGESDGGGGLLPVTTTIAAAGIGMIACVLAIGACVCFKIKKKAVVVSHQLDVSIELDAAIEMEANPLPTESSGKRRNSGREYYYDSDEGDKSHGMDIQFN